MLNNLQSVYFIKAIFLEYLENAEPLKLFHQLLISVMYDDRLYNFLLLVFFENFFHFYFVCNVVKNAEYNF